MSESAQASPAAFKTPSTLAFYEELPDHFALKQRIVDTSEKETWEVFDRQKKRKLLLKRYKPVVIQEGQFDRLQADFKTLMGRCPINADWPSILALGQDAAGIWFVREYVSQRSLAELLDGGKTFRSHEAARRFLALAQQLNALHSIGLVHGNLKPTNVFSASLDQATFCDSSLGLFQNPQSANTVSVSGDVWSFAALLHLTLTGQTPGTSFDMASVPPPFGNFLSACLPENPNARLPMVAVIEQLDSIVKQTKPSAFDTPTTAVGSTTPPSTAPISPTAPPAQPVGATPSASQTAAFPPGTTCPQCHTPVASSAERICAKCGRHFLEPCLNCQAMNPFWVSTCATCGADTWVLKQQMQNTLNGQKQQILKFRENYGHDKTLPLLKYMSTVTHPDFVAFREWAKSMTALVQKERREVKAYVDQVRAQVNAAMTAQKYEKVQKILEQIPRPLLDEPMRKIYVEAGDALTEVDSLIREIRNAIVTKQYSPLLSCVQRYLELKANDPEAKNLQQKIEKLTTITTPLGMKLRRIPSGRFYMGSHDSDEYLRNNESPQHRVFITNNLFVGVCPVTQAEFRQVMDFNPSVSTENDACPVDSVTWYTALEFCNKMSSLEELPPYYELEGIKRRANGAIEKARVAILGGDGYRLPSEAEWEYACRAGSISPWCFGDQVMDVGEYAWYFDNSGMETHPVGEKKPNPWGIRDCHGNVMEWCYDWYDEYYYQSRPDEEENPAGPEDGLAKVLRGGAWQFGAEATRCAYRNSSVPDAASSVIGLRVFRNATDDVMS